MPTTKMAWGYRGKNLVWNGEDIVMPVWTDHSPIAAKILGEEGDVSWNFWFKRYINSSVAALAPFLQDGYLGSVEYVFFQMHNYRTLKAEEIEIERTKRGLTADLYAQFYVNKCLPEFAYDHPNADGWQDQNGNRYYLSFSCTVDREMYVQMDYDRYREDFASYWWFGGIRACLLDGAKIKFK